MNRPDRTANPLDDRVPDWVPKGALNYLRHIEGGQSIRALARAEGCHASTVLRQVRRIEGRRDDFLIDEALRQIGDRLRQPELTLRKQETARKMTAHFDTSAPPPDEATIEREGRRVLRRLSETGAVLAVAREMDRAVVVREMADGRTVRTGVVERSVAQAMALKDWISCKGDGRISR